MRPSWRSWTRKSRNASKSPLKSNIKGAMVQNHRAFLLSSNMFHPHLVEDTFSAQYGIPSKRVYPQLCADAHDSSLCGGDQRTEPVWRLCDRPLETFARSPLQLCGSQRWQVAAALSAAVTTTKPIGDRTHLTGGTTHAEAHTPNAICSSGEGVWGRGASLREAASPPESPPP